MFQKICAHFNETSEYKVTVDQCIRKWDKLLAKFKQVEDNNKHTGQARQTCKFYDSLQECIGDSPKVNPSTPLMLHVWHVLHQVKVNLTRNVKMVVMSLRLMKVATV